MSARPGAEYIALVRPGIGVDRNGNVYTYHRGGHLRLDLPPRRRLTRLDHHGYERVAVRGNSVLVHRLVLEAFVGPCPPGHATRHLNGVRTDNRLENLTWGTYKENSADQVVHGTANRGELNGAAILTPDQVLLARSLWTGNGGTMTPRQIREHLGLHHATLGAVRAAIYGRTWKYLEVAA